MATRVHIVDSEEPFGYRIYSEARCGLTIENGDPVFMWDEQAMGEPLSLPLGCCRKCLKVEDPRMRYSYGVKV